MNIVLQSISYTLHTLHLVFTQPVLLTVSVLANFRPIRFSAGTISYYSWSSGSLKCSFALKPLRVSDTVPPSQNPLAVPKQNLFKHVNLWGQRDSFLRSMNAFCLTVTITQILHRWPTKWQIGDVFFLAVEDCRKYPIRNKLMVAIYSITWPMLFEVAFGFFSSELHVHEKLLLLKPSSN